MLVYVRTSLFESPAQTLVNTVNTVGVMGKGVALEFKNRYPKMYENYRELCDNGVLTVGKLHLWRGNDQWILNFPTKTTWKKASEYSYIEDGLKHSSLRIKRWESHPLHFLHLVVAMVTWTGISFGR